MVVNFTEYRVKNNPDNHFQDGRIDSSKFTQDNPNEKYTCRRVLSPLV
jgi:hypothetical protein